MGRRGGYADIYYVSVYLTLVLDSLETWKISFDQSGMKQPVDALWICNIHLDAMREHPPWCIYTYFA